MSDAIIDFFYVLFNVFNITKKSFNTQYDIAIWQFNCFSIKEIICFSINGEFVKKIMKDVL